MAIQDAVRAMAQGKFTPESEPKKTETNEVRNEEGQQEQLRNEESVQESNAQENNDSQAQVSESQPQAEAQPEVSNDPQPSLQELQEKLANYEREFESLKTQDPFANESIKKMNELAKSGIDVNSPDFYKWQQVDIDSMSPEDKNSALDLIRLDLSTSSNGLSAEEIAFEIEERYPALFDKNLNLEYEEDKEKYDKAMMRLRIDAKKSKPRLQEYKSNVTLPKVDLNERQKQEELAKQAREEFAKITHEQVNNYKSQEIDLGDLKLNFEVSDDTRKVIESNIVHNETFFQDRYVKDGQVDFNSLQSDMLKLAEFDRIVKMAYDQGISKGKKSVVDNLENTSNNNGGKQSSTEKVDALSLARKSIAQKLKPRF